MIGRNRPWTTQHPDKGYFYQPISPAHRSFGRSNCNDYHEGRPTDRKTSHSTNLLKRFTPAIVTQVEHRYFGKTCQIVLDYQYLYPGLQAYRRVTCHQSAFLQEVVCQGLELCRHQQRSDHYILRVFLSQWCDVSVPMWRPEIPSFWTITAFINFGHRRHAGNAEDIW